VGTAALTKWTIGVTLLLVHCEAAKLADSRKEIKRFSGDNNIVSINTHVSRGNLLLLADGPRKTVKDECLKLKGESVPHTGELLPPKS